MTLALTILAMAALGMGLAIATNAFYRQYAVDLQRASFSEELRTWTSDIRRHLDRGSRGLAYTLQTDHRFTKALAMRDASALERSLDGLYSSASVASGEIAPIELYLYDAELKPILGRSSEEETLERSAACGHLQEMAKRRKDPARLISGNCLNERGLYYSALVPLGNTQAYLLVVVNLARNLLNLETVSGLPVRLSMTDGSLLHQSPRWPSELSATTLVAEYGIDAYATSKTYVLVSVARDEAPFFEKLDQTGRMILGACATVTVLFIVLAMKLLDKVVVAPLRTLATQLRLAHQDESRLGKRVVGHGNSEVVGLAKDFNDMTAKLEQLYRNVDSMAFTDPLTQLPNRTLFHDRLQETVAAARREGFAFALFVMDLDRFKDINDTLGHHIGDKLLQQVALRLKDKLRDSDTLARLGGDEFGVLLPAVDARHAETAARMLAQTLRAPFVVNDHTLDIGMSLGIALYPDHGIDVSTLLQRADVAMYAAKYSGNGYAFYEPESDQNHPSRLELLKELRAAVEREEFVLYYQPIVRLETDRVTAVEALVRWRHPNGELMLPEHFLPLLEQTGLVRALTSWVVNRALADACVLRRHGFTLPIAVNLSVRDLQDPYLAESLAEHLAAYQADPDWLELEFTEGALLAEARMSTELLPKLAAMGFRLVVDDFGTGYSSLASLKRLPLASLKLDRTFVTGLGHDETDAMIVHTSIDLARNLDLQVVAEGVDEGTVLAGLRARGCHSAQGHYICRPLELGDLLDWLENSAWGLARAAAL